MASSQFNNANEVTLDIPSTPQVLRQPMFIPNKTLMGAGPSNTPNRVLTSLSNPTLGHLHAETTKIMDDVKEGIQYIFQTRNTLTIALSASGHGGMEALLCNLLEDGETVLIGSTGIWGHRAATMAARYGAVVHLLESPVGSALTFEQIREALAKYRPALFFIVQGDSSTGVLQKIEGLGDLCHEYNCLLGVDTVASLGGTPFFADRWGVDAVYTGSQKVLGAPAGITPISFSPRAERKILSRRSLVKVYYFDMSILGDYWACFGKPRVYHHTISTTLLYGLREALSMACEEGLPALWSRTKTCAQRLYSGLTAMDVEIMVTDVESRLPTITTIKVPSDVDAVRVIKHAMDKHSLEVAGGLGPTAGKVFRIGLMGPNATPENVDLVLSVLAEAFLTCKLSKM